MLDAATQLSKGMARGRRKLDGSFLEPLIQWMKEKGLDKDPRYNNV